MGRVAHLRNVFEYAGAFLFNRRLVSAMTHPSGTAALGTATFLADGGEMGRRIREFDWSATALGAAAQWPASLKTVVRLMLTTNHAVFVFWGPDLICLYNDAYSRSLGKEQHPSILGMKGPQAWAIAWDVIAPQIALVTSGRGATWYENQRIQIQRHGRLEETYWTYSYGPILDDDAPNGVGGTLVLTTETTKHVVAQKQLRSAEARWRSLFEQAPGFVAILAGSSHRYEFANLRYRELIGARELIGRTVLQVLPEFESQGIIGLLDGVYETGIPFNGTEVAVRLESGTDAREQQHYLDFVYQPIRDDDGTVTGIFVQGSDVTRRVLSNVRLTESEARYRALVEQLPGGAVFVIDESLRFMTAGGEALTGAKLTPQHFVGRTVSEVFDTETVTAFTPNIRKAFGGTAFEVEHQTFGRFYLTRGTPLRTASGTVYGVLAVSYDITDRRAIEEQLRTASVRLAGVMAAGEVGVWWWDMSTNIVDHDRNLARLYGLGDGIASTVEEHFAVIAPEDRPVLEAAIALARTTGHFYVREYRVLGPDGSVRWLGARGQLQRDAQGNFSVMTGLAIDITDLKVLEESLKASDKQKDRFLAMLAHELRNPLAPLLNAAVILESDSISSGDLAWCRDVIGRQTRQMALLLDDLLDISRITHGRLWLDRRTVPFAGIVEAAIETVQPILTSRGHRLHIDLPLTPLSVHVDPDRIAQALANLLGNAAKYTEPGGDIYLHAREHDGLVEIRVRDSGIGLAADDRDRIFSMFSQVDPAGGRARSGLGIGLSLVRGLVELHDGKIDVHSAGLGHGSTFTVRLPAPAH